MNAATTTATPPPMKRQPPHSTIDWDTDGDGEGEEGRSQGRQAWYDEWGLMSTNRTQPNMKRRGRRAATQLNTRTQHDEEECEPT